MIPEIFHFKNKPDKMIILYMNDERAGVKATQLFAEKGFDNTFLLNGGIEKFLEDHYDLCEGKQLPVPKSAILAEEQAKADAKAEKREQRRIKHSTPM